MVSSDAFGILLSVASIWSVDDDPTISLRYEDAVIVSESSQRTARLTASQKENTNDVSHSNFQNRKDGNGDGSQEASNDRSQHDEFLARHGFTIGRISALLVFIFQLCGCAPPASAQSSPLKAAFVIIKQMASAISAGGISRFSLVCGMTLVRDVFLLNCPYHQGIGVARMNHTATDPIIHGLGHQRGSSSCFVAEE